MIGGPDLVAAAVRQMHVDATLVVRVEHEAARDVLDERLVDVPLGVLFARIYGPSEDGAVGVRVQSAARHHVGDVVDGGAVGVQLRVDVPLLEAAAVVRVRVHLALVVRVEH